MFTYDHQAVTKLFIYQGFQLSIRTGKSLNLSY